MPTVILDKTTGVFKIGTGTLGIPGPAGETLNGAEIKALYEAEANTNAYTDSEKAKLAGLDTRNGAPVQDTAELIAISQASLSDKEKRFVEDEGGDFYYDAQSVGPADADHLAPTDQAGGVGFWVRIATVGSETPASIKTKYESNADTNAFTDAEKTKVANALTSVPDGSVTNAKLATEVEDRIADNDAKTGITTDQADAIAANTSKLSTIEDNAKDDQTGAEIKALYEAEANTNAYTDSEKAKLAGLDTRNGAPVQDTAELIAIAQASLSDKEKRFVEDEGGDFYYDAQSVGPADADHLAPTDQAGGVGFWVRIATVGSETPASIKTKYESNADTNAFTDAEKTKVANALTSVPDGSVTNAKLAAEVESRISDNDAKVSYTDAATVAANTAKLSTIEDNAKDDQTGAEIKALYEAEANTNAYTDSEKAKLAGLDTRNGAPVQDTAELIAIAQASLSDKEKRFVEDEGGDFYYDAQSVGPADADHLAPTDQAGGVGFWVRIATGGAETAASIKTKYESNADTNAFTDAEKTKVANALTSVPDSSVTNVKLATEVEDRIAANEAMAIVGGQTITPAQPLDIENKAIPTMELTENLTVTSFSNLPVGGTVIRVIHGGFTLSIAGKTDWVAVESGAEYHVRILKFSDTVARVSDVNGGVGSTTSSTIVTDAFPDPSIDTEKWTVINPSGGIVPSIVSNQLQWAVAAGATTSLTDRIDTILTNSGRTIFILDFISCTDETVDRRAMAGIKTATERIYFTVDTTGQMRAYVYENSTFHEQQLGVQAWGKRWMIFDDNGFISYFYQLNGEWVKVGNTDNYDIGADKVGFISCHGEAAKAYTAVFDNFGLYSDFNLNSSGDMNTSVYDPQAIGADAFSMGNFTETTTAKVFSGTERTALGNADTRPNTFNININTSGVVDCSLGKTLKSSPTTTADREISSVTNLTKPTNLDFTASAHTVKFNAGLKADTDNVIYGDDSIVGPFITIVNKDGGGFIAIYANAKREDSLVIPCSASKTDLAVSTGAFSMPVFEAFTITDLEAGVTTAPVGAAITADIKKNGTTILSTIITIDATETTTLTAAATPVISDGVFATGDVLSIDITQVGSSTAGQELKVWLKVAYS